jgi:hypothetical protein
MRKCPKASWLGIQNPKKVWFPVQGIQNGHQNTYLPTLFKKNFNLKTVQIIKHLISGPDIEW